MVQKFPECQPKLRKKNEDERKVGTKLIQMKKGLKYKSEEELLEDGISLVILKMEHFLGPIQYTKGTAIINGSTVTWCLKVFPGTGI